MILHSPRSRPEPLRAKLATKPLWARPFWMVELVCERLAYVLSHWAFLEVLEYIGSFGVLIAVIFYFAESGDRAKQRHYQAWQVINTAQSKGGSGGRIEALQELNADRISLIGVDVSGAFLQGIRLPQARLSRSNFNAADARNSAFVGADLSNADLRYGNFRESNLTGANLVGASLAGADLTGSTLADCDLSESSLDDADLRRADLRGMKWEKISTVRGANIAGIRNAPNGFVTWSLQHGAVQTPGAQN